MVSPFASEITSLQVLSELLQNRINYLDDPLAELLPLEQFEEVFATSPFFDYPAIQVLELSLTERLVLLLALLPHVFPEELSKLAEYRNHPVVGLRIEKGYLVPTGQTTLFLLGGQTLAEKQRHFNELFGSESRFNRQKIVQLEAAGPGEPVLSGRLLLAEEYLQLWLTGRPHQFQPSSEFPAQLLKTSQDWEDLVLDGNTQAEVRRAKAWLQHYRTLQGQPFYGKDMKGVRLLFEGDPGTGKTLTAKLLAQDLNQPIYRIDLSKIVSKWVGETEKNLEKIFSLAQGRDWILFFDEGESLFGKRGGGNSGNNRFANQEISYLLQKIEDHEGVIILATNIKDYLDKAFLRRFQLKIRFRIPDTLLSEKLWAKAFKGSSFSLHPAIDLPHVSWEYQKLSPAFITSVKHHCGILALAYGSEVITPEIFTEAFRMEFDSLGGYPFKEFKFGKEK